VIAKAPYFDGRDSDFVYEDYDISKRKHYFYILRWKCGPCRNWEYFGAIHLIIPEK